MYIGKSDFREVFMTDIIYEEQSKMSDEIVLIEYNFFTRSESRFKNLLIVIVILIKMLLLVYI